jgi:hypothetical protein
VDKVLDIVTNHEVYLFLDGFLSYHQIQIAFEDCYNMAKLSHIGRFWLGGYVVWVQEFQAPTYQQLVKKAFKDYLDEFMKLF